MGSAFSHRAVLYRNSGNGTFVNIAADPVVTTPSNWISPALGDFSNDELLDLFVAKGGYLSSERNALYQNQGDGTFTAITTGAQVGDTGNFPGAAWADYDNDGFLDLFAANGGLNAQQRNFLYRNNGNSNQWIGVRCIGTVSNRSAIGARVRVRAAIGGKSFWQLREISSSHGFGVDNLLAHFGLGDATVIDTLRLEWPSGIVQEFHDVPPKQFLTVTEPARLQTLGPGAFRIQSWKGMAFEVQTSTDFEQWLPMTTRTNLTGTLVFTDPDASGQARRFYRTVLR